MWFNKMKYIYIYALFCAIVMYELQNVLFIVYTFTQLDYIYWRQT